MNAEYLLKQYKVGRLSQVYLCSTSNLKAALVEIEKFAAFVLGVKEVKNSGEYIFFERDAKSKNISIDQIRDAQGFLNKTSVISGKKIMVIYGADHMNVNSSNSCLKLLEDTPKNTYIFLLTNKPHSLLPTILSRCTKINFAYSENSEIIINLDLIEVLIKSCNFQKKQQFIEKFASKDRNVWQEFATNCENLLAKFVRYKLGIAHNLSENEKEILKQFNSESLPFLEDKYSKLKILINNIHEYDLDLRSSSIILIDQFRQ